MKPLLQSKYCYICGIEITFENEAIYGECEKCYNNHMNEIIGIAKNAKKLGKSKRKMNQDNKDLATFVTMLILAVACMLALVYITIS